MSLKSFVNKWNDFWFSPVGLYRVSFFRLVFGFLILIFYLIRHAGIDLYFYDEGILTVKDATTLFDGKYITPFFWFPHDHFHIQLFHFGFLFCLLCLTLGLWGRFWALLAVIIHVIFLHRNFAIVYGTDKVASCWLFYLALAENDRFFSVRSWFRKRKNIKSLSTDLLTPLAHRFFQFQLCVIYAYSGLDKLRGSTWWTGGALWNIFSNGHVMPFDMSFVANFPTVLALSAFGTLLWEIYFPFAMLNGSTRKAWLLIGVVFHCTIGFLLNLYFFAAVMILGYIFFIDDEKFMSIVRHRAESAGPRKSKTA